MLGQSCQGVGGAECCADRPSDAPGDPLQIPSLGPSTGMFAFMLHPEDVALCCNAEDEDLWSLCIATCYHQGKMFYPNAKKKNLKKAKWAKFQKFSDMGRLVT